MLVKLVFIASREIDRRAEPLLEFFPFDFGPYSKVLAQAVNRMISEGLIASSSEVGPSGNVRTEYRLTSSGRAEAEKSLQTLGPKIVDRLKKLRRGAEQLGYQGILRHVYTRYPEFASASKIRDEVVSASYQY